MKKKVLLKGQLSKEKTSHKIRSYRSMGSLSCCFPSLCTSLCKMRSHEMCCSSKMNRVTSLLPLVYPAPARASSGPLWLLQPCPDLLSEVLRRPPTRATLTATPHSGAAGQLLVEAQWEPWSWVLVFSTLSNLCVQSCSLQEGSR